MALNRKKSVELKALLEQQAEMARQIKEAERAQRAKEVVAEKAAKKSGPAYAGLVLDLCEVLGLEQEHPRIRKGAGGDRVEIAADPNGDLLLARLRDMLERIINEADQDLLDELKLSDDQGRNERRDKREKSKRSTEDEGGGEDEDEVDADAEEYGIDGGEAAGALAYANPIRS